jgi:hypothetical protein
MACTSLASPVSERDTKVGRHTFSIQQEFVRALSVQVLRNTLRLPPVVFLIPLDVALQHYKLIDNQIAGGDYWSCEK